MVTASDTTAAVKRVWSSFTARPGWVPLLLVATVWVANVPTDWWRLSDWQPFSWGNGWLPPSEWRPVKAISDNPTVAGVLLALVSYQLGEIFDDLQCVRARVGRLDKSCEARRDAYQALGVWHGSYSVALGLLKAKGDYAGTLVELYNEGAKFARASVFLVSIMVLMTWPGVSESLQRLELLEGPPWTLALAAFMTVLLLDTALLIWYATWKSNHKTQLYQRAALVVSQSTDGHGRHSLNGLAMVDAPESVDLAAGEWLRTRSYFWDGKLAGTALITERRVDSPTEFRLEVGAGDSVRPDIAAGIPTDLLIAIKAEQAVGGALPLRKGDRLTVGLPSGFKCLVQNGHSRALLLQRAETIDASEAMDFQDCYVPGPPSCFWQEELSDDEFRITLAADFPVGVFGPGFSALRVQLPGLRNPPPGEYRTTLDITHSDGRPPIHGTGALIVQK